MKGLSYHQRLVELKLETLEARRLRTDLLTMFKILHNITAVDFTNFSTSSNVTNTTGHRFKLVKSLSRHNA
jgi:hypothetical protein